MIDTSYETGRVLGYSDSIRLNESPDCSIRGFLWYTGGIVLFLTMIGVALIWIFTLAMRESRMSNPRPFLCEQLEQKSRSFDIEQQHGNS